MLTLTAKPREILGRKNDLIREQGLIPAVVYGPEIKNQNLSIDRKEFNSILAEAGKTSLITLNIEGAKDKLTVLIQEIDVDPVSDKCIHVDFYQPNLSHEIEAEIPLIFEGESPAVEDFKGTLVKNISEISVKALPQSLPKEIKVDISRLATFEDAIKVSDLNIPSGVKTLKEADDIVAIVVPMEKVEEELEKPIEEKVENVEKVEKEKEEGEEGESSEKSE